MYIPSLTWGSSEPLRGTEDELRGSLCETLKTLTLTHRQSRAPEAVEDQWHGLMSGSNRGRPQSVRTIFPLTVVLVSVL
jgi:hypothetical protein